MDITDILKLAAEKKGSDIFVVPGAQISIKMDGSVSPMIASHIMPDEALALVKQVYTLAGDRDIAPLVQHGDDDFSFSVHGVGRFRCNAFMQRNSYAMVLRVVSFELPKPEDFNIPETVVELGNLRKGMVLVTGSAGSGKSTTLACIIDRINATQHTHIITIEDPIEFMHPHKQSIVSQRELGHDTEDTRTALRSALRQAPGVLLLGEMRDYETIHTALTAAETGQLVLSTLHTVGAAKTVDRIIDIFPANQQQQVRIQLSMILKAVVSQQLIPTSDGKLFPAFEIMIVNNAIQNMIREGKIYQIDNVIQSGAALGMRTMDADILKLYKDGRISRENALLYAAEPDILVRKL